MQLIVISHPDTVANEARVINQLFDAGLTCFHLRKPDWDEKQLVNLLRQIDQTFYPYIALHQHHHIAVDFNTKRLHYTEKHRLATEPKKLILQKEEGYILSTSTHADKDLRSFKNFVSLTQDITNSSSPPFDYTFFGPVFNSISKAGYQSQLPNDFQLPPNIAIQIIALGGVEPSNLDKLKLMGFDGAAVLGTIWNDSVHAVTNFRKLQEHLLTKQA